MKIAILLTSNDCSDFAKRFPTDDIKYIDLLQPLRSDWQFDRFAVWQGDFPENITLYDGVIITGSPASVHDGDSWIQRLLILIRLIHQRKIRLFGGCFGHQAIALALGGSVGKNNKNAWSIGLETTRFNDKPHFMRDLSDQITLYSIHKEEVTQIPKGAKSIASNDFCRYPAFTVGDKIFTTQYHPEMTADFLHDLTFELEGELPETILEKAREDFSAGHQGKEFAKAIIGFFEQPA